MCKYKCGLYILALGVQSLKMTKPIGLIFALGLFFVFRYFTSFQDGVTYNVVTTQFAERFFLFNPLLYKKNSYILMTQSMIENLTTYLRAIIAF